MTLITYWKKAYELYCEALAFENALHKIFASHNHTPTEEGIGQYHKLTLAALANLREAFAVLTDEELEKSRLYTKTREGKKEFIVVCIPTPLGYHTVKMDYMT